MADQVDPVLELLLRTTLRAEAASVPFRLRAEDIRPVTTRARSRGWPPIVLVAALVAVGLVGGGVLLAGRYVPPDRTVVPSPVVPVGVAGLSSLPSFEQLGDLVTFDREIARGERGADGTETVVLHGEGGVPWTEVLFACQGVPPRLGPVGTNLDVFTSERVLNCGGGGRMRFPARGTPSRPEDGLWVEAPAGTAWRAIVIGRSQDVADVPAGTDGAVQLPSFDTIVADRPGGVVLATGRGTAASTDQSFVLGPITWTGEVLLVGACTDGSAQLAFGTMSTVDAGLGYTEVACDRAPQEMRLPTGPANPAWDTLRIRLSAGTSWAAVVLGDALPTASAAP